MVVGTRQKTVGGNSYRNDPLYAYGKAFVEAANSILATESMDIFGDPKRSLNSIAVKESLKEFFCENFVNESDCTKSAEQIEDELEDVKEMFENDMAAIKESAYMSDYAPMIGMSLPIHKLILMNNVFAQGGGIQKVVAQSPSFTISMERRILKTPDGQEIDFFTEQNKIAGAIDATAPTVEIELEVPHEEGKTDIVGLLGGTAQDELSIETRICGIFQEKVYFAEGDRLPDENGWYTGKGEVATSATAGERDVWFPVQLNFTPNYGGPNRLERSLNAPVSIKYKKNETEVAELKDIIFASMNNNKVTIVAAN